MAKKDVARQPETPVPVVASKPPLSLDSLRLELVELHKLPQETLEEAAVLLRKEGFTCDTGHYPATAVLRALRLREIKKNPWKALEHAKDARRMVMARLEFGFMEDKDGVRLNLYALSQPEDEIHAGFHPFYGPMMSRRGPRPAPPASNDSRILLDSYVSTSMANCIYMALHKD